MIKDRTDIIENYLEEFNFSTTAEKAFIKPHIQLKQYDKGELFLSEGNIQQYMGYLHSGLMRRFYVNEKGKEITTGFVKEKEYATDYPAFIRQYPTKYYIKTLEKSIVVLIPYEKIMESYEIFQNGERYGRLVAEKVLTILSDRIESFLFNTAEERYLKFITEHPELMNRISLTHLASFLGIERQSLSRIRKKIVEK